MKSQTEKIRELAFQYFEAWNNHDLDKLGEIISDDVTLIDWEISVSGSIEFLRANRDIFQKNPGIKAKLTKSFVDGNDFIAILDISSQSSDEVHRVVDHISFKNNKIASIMAYRGF